MSASVISGIGELVAVGQLRLIPKSILCYSQVEYHSQREDENCNCKVYPLYVLEGFLVIAYVVEDGVAADDWRDLFSPLLASPVEAVILKLCQH